MGFYSPSQLVQDAKAARSRGEAPLDVQESGWDHRLNPEVAEPCERLTSRPALRLGLRMVKGLSEESGRRIELLPGRSGARTI